ncbi:hypothetical protein KCU73_g6031, partial [Aureobasidium melanogenum]
NSDIRRITLAYGLFSAPPSAQDCGVEFIKPRKKDFDETETVSAMLSAHNADDDADNVYLMFSVTDTGCGLTSEESQLLFQRFAQAPKTYKQYGGSGLGLFISRELVELQKGQIGLHSEPSVGSRFAFYIQAKHAARRSRAGSVASVESTISVKNVPHSVGGSFDMVKVLEKIDMVPQGRTLVKDMHILLVEDNLINSKVMAKQLRKLGCEVDVAENGLEALNHLSKTTYLSSTKEATPLSLILLDVEMPIMDGLTCIRRIRALEQSGEIFGHVPVIAITANARNEQIAAAIEAGMDSVVTKPFTIKDLVPQMEALVDTCPDCCEVYAASVVLNYWYTGHIASVNNGTLITKYMKYNDTIVPISTITVPPTSRLSPGIYGPEDENVVVPGVPTDLIGSLNEAAYITTMIESVADTGNSTRVAFPSPYMKFSDFYVIAGHMNSDGIFVAQVPYAFDVGHDLTNVSVTGFDAQYYSNVTSSQTSTWGQEIVTTELGEELFAWLTKQPSILSQVPYIMSCSPVSAAGAPQVHIPVSFLTSSSAITSTTNAMYFNAAATTSAVPASKTPSVVINTKAATSSVPSPTTSEVPAETASGVPAQPAENQEAGATSKVSSNSSENQPTQSTTVQGEGASSNQPAPSITEGASSNEPSQQHAQSTVTQNAAASPAAPADESTDKPTQPATSQGAPSIIEGLPSSQPFQQPAQSTVTQDAAASSTAPADEPFNNPNQPAISQGAPSVVLSHEPSAQPDQTSTVQEVGQAGSAQADSKSRVVQSSVPAVVVIGDATATVISPTATPAEITTSNTGGHIVNVPTNAESVQTPGTVVVGSSQPTSGGDAYAIGSQTLRPGGPAIEISGTTYSVQESGGVVVNGNTVSISTVVPQSLVPPASVVIGGVAATPVASDKYVIASQTLSRGGPAVEISGTTYSLPPSARNVIINGQAAPISTMQASLGQPATVVMGGITAKPESSGAYYLVADQILSPGGSAIEVSGVTYSLPTSGANIVINGATSIMAQSNIATVSAVVFGSATAVPLLAGGYVVGSQVISPGGSAVEISGTAYTAVAASATPLVVASQTLVPGGSDITVGGTTFSLPPDAKDSIVVNGQTTSLTTGASGDVGLSSGSMELSFTPLNSGIIIASQTLYPGSSAIVVQGETLSIPVDGTAVVIQSGTTTTTKGLGGYVWQGIASPTSSSASRLTSGVESGSVTSVLSGSSTRAGVETSKAAVSTGTGSASSAQTSTSDASGQQSASSVQPATMALVICLFVIVLW